MILNAIYGYLIFSVCCGGVLAALLWADNRREKAQALEAEQQLQQNNGRSVAQTTISSAPIQRAALENEAA